MNDRIRELVQDAGFVGYGEDLGSYHIPVPAFNSRMEKFAELIVKECMSIIKQGEGLGEEDDFDKGFQAGIAMAYNRVRTQMGVQ